VSEPTSVSGRCAAYLSASCPGAVASAAKTALLLLAIIGALQTIDGDHNVGPLEHLNQPVEKALVVVRSRLEILFNDALSGAYGLKRQLLIGHKITPGTKVGPASDANVPIVTISFNV
jgi:hypothetical protein